MMGTRTCRLSRRMYRSIIVFQCVFIVVLIYLAHKREYDVVVSRPTRDTGNQFTNRHTTLEGYHQENNVNSTSSTLDNVYLDRFETAQWFCDVDWDENWVDYAPRGKVWSYRDRDTSIHYCGVPKTAQWFCDVDWDEDWLDYAPRGKVWSYRDRDTSIHYCGVPKVGTTVWKRVFRFLHKDFPNSTAPTPTRPSDIDRVFAHYGDIANVDIADFECFTSLRKYVGGSFFMFTRDPYSRLWSAYIDKFFLPDFWKTAAMRTFKVLRRGNVTIPKNNRCFKNITFTEFLKSVVITRKSPNEHWAPIHTLCSPCHVEFDFIGKQETFFEDYAYILKKNKLGHFIEKESFESRVKHETSMLINYNFSIKKRYVNQTGCFVPRDVAERLWKVFQYNGYIHEHIGFPAKAINWTRFEVDPIKTLQRLVRKTTEDQQRLGLSIKGQKRAKMVEAYKGVPNELLKAVQDVYVHDFEIFDYDKEPVDIFGA